ncbi:MAG: S1 family peptidase [Planctomycetota bacterium]|jgi:S1-C subfamily serine protease
MSFRRTFYIVFLVVWTAAMIFAAASSPAAEPVEQPTRAVPQPQCIRIVVQDRGNSMSHGTATYLGAGLVVTCQHNVRDTRTNQVQLVFPQDATYMGTIIFTDRKQDICIVAMPVLPNCEGMTLALEMPEVGTPLAVQGYAKGTYRQVWGRLSHRKYGARGVTWRVVGEVMARQGDSGGPIIDAQGRFVGTLWGSVNDHGGETHFTSAKWIVDKILEIGRELEANEPPPTVLYKTAGRYHQRTRTKRFYRRVA